jgi:hypothetical protein
MTEHESQGNWMFRHRNAVLGLSIVIRVDLRPFAVYFLCGKTPLIASFNVPLTMFAAFKLLGGFSGESILISYSVTEPSPPSEIIPH